jgi:hypothetical protein
VKAGDDAVTLSAARSGGNEQKAVVKCPKGGCTVYVYARAIKGMVIESGVETGSRCETTGSRPTQS